MTALRPAPLLAALLAGCLATAALAGETASMANSALRPADACLFFRGQAYKRAIDDFATEMLLACEVIARRRAAGVPLSDRLIATEATVHTKVYQDRLSRHGYECLVLDVADSERLFWPAVRKVKTGDTKGATPLLEEAVERLTAAGAARVVLGCTEVPVGLAPARKEILDRCFDATDALALACVEWALAEAVRAS